MKPGLSAIKSIPSSRVVSFSIADILRKVDQLSKDGLRDKEKQLSANEYIAWRRNFHERQHVCVEALRKALARPMRASSDLKSRGRSRFEFRIGKRWIIRIPKAATHSIPAALATAIAVLAFEH